MPRTGLLLVGLLWLALWPGAAHGQSPELHDALDRFAHLYAEGRYQRALPFAEKALRLSERELGSDHPTTATSLNELAVLYKAQGRYAEAEPLHQRALAIFEKALGPEHPHVATSLNNLAGLYTAQGKYAETEPLHTRANLSHLRPLYLPVPSENIDTLGWVANVRLWLGTEVLDR